MSLPSAPQLLGNHCSALRVCEHDCFRALVEQGPHAVCYLVAGHACHFKSDQIQNLCLLFLPVQTVTTVFCLFSFLSYLSFPLPPGDQLSIIFKSKGVITKLGTSLAVQWLKLTLPAGVSVIPGWATKIPHAAQRGQKI